MERNANEHIAAEVRAHLARRRRSGKQLASALDLSAFAVSRRLRGQTPFSASELQATAGFLGVDVADLLPPDADRRPAEAATA